MNRCTPSGPCSSCGDRTLKERRVVVHLEYLDQTDILCVNCWVHICRMGVIGSRLWSWRQRQGLSPELPAEMGGYGKTST